MTIAVFAAAVALGMLCVSLLFLAARRIIGRHEEIITTMLTRYDERLGEFAQTLNDALSPPLPERISAAITGAPAREIRTTASCACSRSHASALPQMPL